MFDNIPNALTFIVLVVKYLCATNRKSAVTRSDWESARALVIRVDEVVAANPGTHLTPYQRYVLDNGCKCLLARVEAATGRFDVSPATTAKWEAAEKGSAAVAKATRRCLKARAPKS